MMKSYLRYEPKTSHGVIASPHSNIQYDFSGNLAITGTIQDINIWNLRLGNLVLALILSIFR
jgi:U3 small nucleolar RNA-associated protein 12